MTERPQLETLPLIPKSVRLQGIMPTFARVPELSEDWLVCGRDRALLVGGIARVRQHSSGEVKEVRVKEHIAERTVRHARDRYTYSVEGEATRWVLATFIRASEHLG